MPRVRIACVVRFVEPNVLFWSVGQTRTLACGRKDSMASRNLRTLRIDTDVFFWRVRHIHEFPAPDTRRCIEVFSAYLDRCKRAPLRIRFPEAELQGSGFPLQKGVIVDSHEPSWSMNLNRPAAARLLVRLGLVEGWAPRSQGRELLVPDGFALLRAHRQELDAFLSTPPAEDPRRAALASSAG